MTRFALMLEKHCSTLNRCWCFPGLQGLSSLERLDCSFNQLGSLSSHSLPQQLTSLTLTSNALSSLHALSMLKGLRRLYASVNRYGLPGKFFAFFVLIYFMSVRGLAQTQNCSVCATLNRTIAPTFSISPLVLLLLVFRLTLSVFLGAVLRA